MVQRWWRVLYRGRRLPSRRVLERLVPRQQQHVSAMMRSRLVIAATTAGMLGCGQAHGDPAGIDPSTRLVTLTAAQWTALCEWHEGLRQGAPLDYFCMGDPLAYVAPPGTCSPGVTCDRFRWSASTCSMPAGSDRAFFSMQPAGCALTVGQWTACQERGAALVCFDTASLPECVSVYSGCASDAGIGPDGG